MAAPSSLGKGPSIEEIVNKSSTIGRLDETQSYVIKILSGNGNKELSEAVASALNVSLVSAEIGQFSDGYGCAPLRALWPWLRAGEPLSLRFHFHFHFISPFCCYYYYVYFCPV